MPDPAGPTWDATEALGAMAAAHAAVEARGLSPFAPPLYELGGRVVAAFRARDLRALVAACGEMIEAAGRLPPGKFPWKPEPVPEPPGRGDRPGRLPIRLARWTHDAR